MNLTRTLAFGLSLSALSFAVGCGSSVDLTGNEKSPATSTSTSDSGADTAPDASPEASPDPDFGESCGSASDPMWEAGTNGTSCSPSNANACSAGWYCDVPSAGYCGSTMTGTCMPIPATCTADDSPVCGCDHNTYANPCDASAHGQSIASNGACLGVAGQSCGGGLSFEPNPPCGAGLYCNYPPASLCGGDDGSGVCTPIPQLCQGSGTTGVCGCDGKTYLNTCIAAQNGTGVMSDTGPCATP